MAMTKERKRLYGILRKKYGYVTTSLAGEYSGLSRILENKTGEIHVFLDSREKDSDPVVTIKSYATISIDELVILGKIAEEFKKEIEEERSKNK